MSHKLGVFLAGSLLGAGVALLYAPRTGAQTRQLVADRANLIWGQAQDLGSQAAERSQEIYDEAVEHGQAFYTEATAASKRVYEQASNRAADAVNSVKPAFVEKNDDLRSKIDAARERIAAQVAKNAEAAQEAEVADDAPAQEAVVEEIATPEAKAVTIPIDGPKAE